MMVSAKGGPASGGRRAHHKMNRRGYTLVELITMVAVGAVLLTGLGLAIQNQMKAAIKNRDYLVALNLAKRQMALVNIGSYPAVAVETALTADADFPDFIPTQEVVSVDTSVSDSLREIRVRIRRDSISGEVLITLYTYRSNILTFGNGI